ncbi:MAG TPA: hypothetical protein DD490_16585, partial [Acidobacteria bacterium]|nr:hypothetical protein [Acidobacteriota bacterium]
ARVAAVGLAANLAILAVLRHEQRGVLLNTIAGSAQAAAYSFLVPPRADDAEDANVSLAGIVPGVYLVRLQVDGAESPLDVDTDPASPTFGRFIGPVIDLTGGTLGEGKA